MKVLKFKEFRAIIFMVFIGIFTSCMSKNSENLENTMEQENEQKLDFKVTKDDAQFLVRAAEISYEGIFLGQLALQKDNLKHVKELGKMMKEDHTKSLNDLKTLAKRKDISLPESQTKNSEDAYQKLDKKSGNEFGKDYSEMMVNEHKNAITLFEKAVIESSDLDIRTWANATIPILKKHLHHASICLNECNKMY